LHEEEKFIIFFIQKYAEFDRNEREGGEINWWQVETTELVKKMIN
jgi:hypothetical protein